MKRNTRARSGRTPLKTLVLTALIAVMVVWAVPAFASLSVPLKSAHIGASSETFGQDSDDGGLDSPVVWHFILNGLPSDTQAASLSVTFAGAGTKTATARVVGQGKTQHFYVGTSGHDRIVAANAMVDAAEAGQLVLSHVRVNVVPDDDDPTDDDPTDDDPTDDDPTDDDPTDDDPTDDDPADDDPTDDDPADDDPTDDDPTDEDPTDDDPTDDDPTDEDPTDDDPTDDDPTDEDPTDEDDPFLPFTEDDPADTEEDDPFLPYTGGPLGALLGWAVVTGSIGAALKRFAN